MRLPLALNLGNNAMKRKYYDIQVRGVIAQSGARMYEIQENQRTGYVDAEHFAKNPSDAIGGLVKAGLTFVGPKRARLLECLADVDDFEPTNLFDRIGHNGAHFVYPSGEVFSPRDCEPGEVIFTPSSEKCHRVGSLNDWLARVAQPLAGNSICEFFLMIPFAGPLRALTQRVMNFGWELVGDGGTGKSVLLQLMCSTCGGSLGGNEGNFGLSFSATKAGIEWEMQNYSDLVMCIDEGDLFEMNLGKAARGRAFSELLMALGKGQERHRYRTSARTFKFVFATSANETLLDIIGGTSAGAVIDAVADRLMTIPLAGRELGIFDCLPSGYDDVGDLFADLVGAAAQNHGTAMPHYIEKLVTLVAENRDRFIERIDQHLREFRREARIEANAGSATRVADAFGLVYAAGRLAIHLGSLPSEFDPLGSALYCYRLHRSAFRPQPSAAETLLALLDDDEVIDLDRIALPRLSKRAFDETKAFRKTNRYGELELLIPPASIRRNIPDWNRVRRADFEVARMIRREGDAHTVHRAVRVGVSPDRVICIVPDQSTSRLSVAKDKNQSTRPRRGSHRRKKGGRRDRSKP